MSGADFLRLLLAAREERALAQKIFLSSASDGCLVQITPNVPGLPKRIENDASAALAAEASFKRRVAFAAAVRATLVNHAGVAVMLLFPSLDPTVAKMAGIEVENIHEWGRAVDIDVISRDGAVSRKDLGFPARTCLICGDDAKYCARERRHDIAELRACVRRLLADAEPG
jgi:holo-ACP synthase CitX